jgi:hypothetical protein
LTRPAAAARVFPLKRKRKLTAKTAKKEYVEKQIGDRGVAKRTAMKMNVLILDMVSLAALAVQIGI